MIIGLCFFIVSAVLYWSVEYFIFIKSTYLFENYSDKISVHFIHGSYPKKNCIDQRKRVGGLLGGHVEIELEGLVYGFEFDSQRNIHIFSSNKSASFNSRCTQKQMSDWLEETKYDRITTIVIPIDTSKKNQLIDKFQSYHIHAPYDYAFFGMRCASFTYESIAEAGILTEKSRIWYMLNAFYPRQLRKKTVRWAKHNNLVVEYKEGIACRVWE